MVIVRFYLYESAIDTVLTNHKKFVNTENKFSRNRKFEFQDIIKFFLFNKGSSNQDDSSKSSKSNKKTKKIPSKNDSESNSQNNTQIFNKK